MKEILKSGLDNMIYAYFISLIVCSFFMFSFLLGTIPTILLKFTIFTTSPFFYGFPALVTSTAIGMMLILTYTVYYKIYKDIK